MTAPFIRFGNALSRAHLSAGLTRHEMAVASGLTKTEAFRFCQGKRMPTLQHFAQITLRAGLDPIPLLQVIDDMQKEENK